MIFREANTNDIGQLHSIRLSVKENVLHNPSLVTEANYVNLLSLHGKGWLCEVDNNIVGFAIIDCKEHNVWALFVLPEFEGKGIGKKLQEIMLNWYFNEYAEKLWLGTSPIQGQKAFTEDQVGRKWAKDKTGKSNLS